MAHGHTIPIVDMAKLFASRGVKITIVTTPLNALSISKSVGATQIELLVLKFPSVEAGLQENCRSLDSISSGMLPNFLRALSMFEGPLEQALLEKRPNCLVADMFFPWTTNITAKVGIPRLTFHGTGFFSLCTAEFVRLHEPYKGASSDFEPFTIPCLPGDIKFTKMQLPGTAFEALQPEFADIMNRVGEAESKCYGAVVNSFYEPERDYADCYRNALGRRAWHIGPLFLWNKETEEKAQIRGREAFIDEHKCLKWLDLKNSSSVVYICFGSLGKFDSAQLKEIAYGLEASAQQFIWVVRKGKAEEDDQDWLPEGFEQGMEGKCLIIRGWAPQVLILDHPAVGGFVTHCGWNSTLEGVTAGVPMVTWPTFADQFNNEKLVTEILKIAVPVEVQKWVKKEGESIKRVAIEKAITKVMVGEESEKIRSRAREVAEQAWKAVAEGGSSCSDLNASIEELETMVS